MTKRCPKCGETKPLDEFYRRTGRNRISPYCKSCYSAYQAKILREKLRERKRKAVEYKGGKCERCEYDRCIAALEFHHRDPEQKEFKFGRAHGPMDQLTPEIIAELDKCDLLCANCHREAHNMRP